MPNLQLLYIGTELVRNWYTLLRTQIAGTKKPVKKQVVLLVGTRGFEPPTPDTP